LKAAVLEQAWRDELRRDAAFLKNWDLVKLCSPDRRYVTTDAVTARELIEAVGNRNHGVLQRIKLHWQASRSRMGQRFCELSTTPGSR
jgi:hypothetical protein